MESLRRFGTTPQTIATDSIQQRCQQQFQQQ